MNSHCLREEQFVFLILSLFYPEFRVRRRVRGELGWVLIIYRLIIKSFLRL